MHDVQNICWKLALVLNGVAGEELLSTYADERRPVDARNVRRSLENAGQWRITWDKLRLSDPDLTVDEKWAHLSRLWSDDPADDEFKQFARDLFAHHSMEFHEQNIEYGYTYSSSAVVDDGTQPLPNPDEIRLYLQETRPGHPLPHAWVEKSIGAKTSTINLVTYGRFLLIIGEDGSAWRAAADEVARSLRVPLDVVSIAHTSGDYLDPRLAWTRNRGVTGSGAVLVRPDRFVGWRSTGPAADPVASLTLALSHILHRS
jgi:2,4-dichlorophenol 6-monooxygenase